MTNLELVRLKIDDQLTDGYEEAVSDGEKFLYELDYHPVQDVVVKYNDDVKTVDTDYILNQRTGGIKLIDPTTASTTKLGKAENQGVVIRVQYKYAAFLDTDIEYFLENNGDDATKAAIAAIRVLLASSAKRFDYKQGHTEMSVSQVFSHLQTLLETLEAESNAANTTDFSIGKRSVKDEIYLRESDLSRADDINTPVNRWSRDL